MSATTTSIAEMKSNQGAVSVMPDQAVDMFTERGFVLANRIAKAFATSDAVPAQFRQFNLKKGGGEEQWVENTSAIGNCLVAIEVARAVRMSITAVMQNADMIEGKLRWSGKFVIAAINASGRFHPLRFQFINKGPIKAGYKEKTGWDKEARRPVFTERTVDVENIECIAWTLPKTFALPGHIATLAQAKEAQLPVIEGAPVSMKMAVEEGWYGKPGSKWQTELRVMMFQYRAGSFFGNIHAPDIVMGMGQSAEEARDLAPTFDMGPDGSFSSVPIHELRPPAPGPVPMADIVEPTKTAAAQADPATGEIPEKAQAAAQPAVNEAKQQPKAEAKSEGWQPSDAEMEAIHQREMAEAQAADPKASATKAPAARGSRMKQPID